MNTLGCVSFISLNYHVLFSIFLELIQPSEINILFVIPCPSSNTENEYCFAVHRLPSQCKLFCSYRVVKSNLWLFSCWVLFVCYYSLLRRISFLKHHHCNFLIALLVIDFPQLFLVNVLLNHLFKYLHQLCYHCSAIRSS